MFSDNPSLRHARFRLRSLGLVAKPSAAPREAAAATVGVDRVADCGALRLRPRTTAGCNGFPSWLTTSLSSRSIRGRSSVADHTRFAFADRRAPPPKSAGGSSRRHPNALAGLGEGARALAPFRFIHLTVTTAKARSEANQAANSAPTSRRPRSSRVRLREVLLRVLLDVCPAPDDRHRRSPPRGAGATRREWCVADGGG